MQTSIQFSKNGVKASLKLEVDHTALHSAFSKYSAHSNQTIAATEAYSGHLESDAVQQLPIIQALVHTALLGIEISLVEQLHPELCNPVEAISTTPPAVGEYWANQGGIYAGITTNGERQWHLVLAIDPASKIKAPWGKFPNEISGEFSDSDGNHNCLLISKAEPDNKIISHLTQLNIDGHTDFYLPSKNELKQLYKNIPEQFEKIWHWTSTQYSALHAWGQDFGDGFQGVSLKDIELAVRAVRRLPIQ